MRNLKILLVDDDPVVSEITRAVLEKVGHEVLTRSSALGTTALILRERPDVVLLDLEMPALPGADFLDLLREQDLLKGREGPTFLLYSGASDEELARLVEKTGVRGAISKSGGPEAFLEAFERLVG